MESGTLALQVGCSINIDSINTFSNAKDLDYDFGQKIYSLKFNLTDAEDRFGNQMSLPNSLLVNINDIPDQPPLCQHCQHHCPQPCSQHGEEADA